jgi:translation initiation factor 3 subunit A
VQLQVEQMDKERRELNERMRIIAKRMDHIERAFRKAEIPLIVDDYSRQQSEDKAAFYATSQGTLDAAKQVHRERLDAKQRLSRIMPDYEAYADRIAQTRQHDYSSRSRAATEKIFEEKLKRRTAVLKEKEQQARAKEEAERIRKEMEAEEARLEQGAHADALHVARLH